MVMAEDFGSTLNLRDDEKESPVVEETSPEAPEKVDLGNHEADEVVEPPHVNDEGKLVDKDGNRVFTTTEEAVRDGSLVLDKKGRMPGVYLEDVEEELAEKRRKAYEAAYKKSDVGVNTLVERQVNVVNSPLPPSTVVSTQEHPVPEETVDYDKEPAEV
jgi:hypothetical protein